MKKLIVKFVSAIIIMFMAFFLINLIGLSGILNRTSYKVKTSEGDTIIIKVQKALYLRSANEQRVEISVKGFKGTASWVYEDIDIRKGSEKVSLIESGKNYRKYNISFENDWYSIIIYLDTEKMHCYDGGIGTKYF